MEAIQGKRRTYKKMLQKNMTEEIRVRRRTEYKSLNEEFVKKVYVIEIDGISMRGVLLWKNRYKGVHE